MDSLRPIGLSLHILGTFAPRATAKAQFENPQGKAPWQPEEADITGVKIQLIQHTGKVHFFHQAERQSFAAA